MFCKFFDRTPDLICCDNQDAHTFRVHFRSPPTIDRNILTRETRQRNKNNNKDTYTVQSFGRVRFIYLTDNIINNKNSNLIHRVMLNIALLSMPSSCAWEYQTSGEVNKQHTFTYHSTCNTESHRFYLLPLLCLTNDIYISFQFMFILDADKCGRMSNANANVNANAHNEYTVNKNFCC